MSQRIFVAGVGVISAIGKNVAECLDSLENSRAGMGDMIYLNSVHKQKIPVAEVKMSNDDLARLSDFSKTKSRTALLSVIAAKEALNNSGIENIQALRTGFISANSVGGMDKTEKFFAEFFFDNQKGRLRDVVDHECGSISELVADQLGIKDYITTISTACSSSANAIFFGARLIKNNILDVVVAGGADALTKFTLNGFNTLMILDEQFCQPFDENRRGLNLGEGAGYIVLVSEKVATSLKKKPSVTLSGFCNANDAYHQTASSPDGTGSYLAMQGALKKSGLQPADIDYINLHGTGTQNNDIAEGTAIMRLFDPPYPKMSSTKSFTGHTLGGSGGIEAVFSILAVEHGIIYPSLRLQTPMKELPFVPETKLTKNVKIKNVLSNSFGFGGNCTSLIFSKL
jgi:3-oxoacyl-[acyl-carrier-protein] synthase-1